jgi:hypothetical protein
MSDAELALAEFAGTRAHEKATEAADLLESFLSKCQGMGEACANCLGLKFEPGMSECLATTAAQLLAEAGLRSGRGPGLGEGAASGYSAQRGTMSNVGLYGTMPALGPQGSGRGTEEPAVGPGGLRVLAAGQNSDAPSLIDPSLKGDAAGAGQGAIPWRYRRKVGQYFQRLAEELAE